MVQPLWKTAWQFFRKTNTESTCVCVLSAQSCLILCNPMDCSPPGSSVHGIFPRKNTRAGCYFLLQGIFPAQRSNPSLLHLLHWQADSLLLVPPGKPHGIKCDWAIPFLDLCMLSHFSCVKTLGNPLGHSPPGSSVHGILQARILEWVSTPSSKLSSQTRDQTCVFGISYPKIIENRISRKYLHMSIHNSTMYNSRRWKELTCP